MDSITAGSRIITSSSINASGNDMVLNLLGGKAKSLATLSKAGFPVPEWFVVTPSAFYDLLPPEKKIELEKAKSETAAKNPLDSLEIKENLLKLLQKTAEIIFLNKEKMAVRSSASDEDGMLNSFAGQLETYLDISLEELPEKIIQVWRSGFTEKVYAYFAERKIPHPPTPPAVLVQKMIKSSAAGVAFSADPVTGRRGTAVVSSVPGLGTSLVSGECDADTWHINEKSEIISRQIPSKKTMHIGNGQSTPVPQEKQDAPSLNEEQVLEVAKLARQCENFFGMPQDIEWAYESGKLYLLQSRPITSLFNMPDPDGILNVWDNSNIAESYGGVTTPLTFSFARKAYEGVYQEFCRIMGVSQKNIESNAAVFRCMLGLIQGRLYYNLLNWYRLLAMLPGFKMNRGFMEQMMGVKEALPEKIAEEIGKPTRGQRFRDAVHFLSSFLGLGYNYFALEKKNQSFYKRLDQALGTGRPNLSRLSVDELSLEYRDLEKKLLKKWDAPLINDFFAMMFFGILKKLSVSWCGDKEGTLQNDLVSGEGNMISREPAERVKAMAQTAAQDKPFAALLQNRTLEEITAAIPKHPEFQKAYESYLEKFGDRCTDELKLESLTLFDNPLPLLRSIGELALNGKPIIQHEETNLRKKAEALVKNSFSGKPFKQFFFHLVLKNARSRVRDRENLRFERTRVFGRVRNIFSEIGKRLYSFNLLENSRDVFYLELEEIFGFMEGTSSATDLKGLVSLRKKEFENYASMPPPPNRFETRGMVYQGNSFTPKTTSVAQNGDSKKGIGCCPGIIRAKIQIVKNPQETRVISGKIFAAERTDPSWIMIFPLARGVLVERGSLLSHSAIVAREMGIPTIVSIDGLMGWLQDGDEVEMDGKSGIVRKLTPQEMSKMEKNEIRD
jgi:pyruvate,water dikinase